MAVTYPLTFPSLGVTDSTLRLVRVTSESRSPFTGEQQTVRHGGEWWEGEITLRACTRADFADMKAFLLQLRGRFGTFLYGDPDALALGARGSLSAPSTVTVDGAGQFGNSLNVAGFTNSATGVLLKGDYFQLGTGSNARLYCVTNNINANGSGDATIEFEPALRSSPADGATVTLASPKGVFKLVEDSAEWQSNAASIHTATLAFREVL